MNKLKTRSMLPGTHRVHGVSGGTPWVPTRRPCAPFPVPSRRPMRRPRRLALGSPVPTWPKQPRFRSKARRSPIPTRRSGRRSTSPGSDSADRGAVRFASPSPSGAARALPGARRAAPPSSPLPALAGRTPLRSSVRCSPVPTRRLMRRLWRDVRRSTVPSPGAGSADRGAVRRSPSRRAPDAPVEAPCALSSPLPMQCAPFPLTPSPSDSLFGLQWLPLQLTVHPLFLVFVQFDSFFIFISFFPSVTKCHISCICKSSEVCLFFRSSSTGFKHHHLALPLKLGLKTAT